MTTFERPLARRIRRPACLGWHVPRRGTLLRLYSRGSKGGALFEPPAETGGHVPYLGAL